jgi:hypothetical protein
MWIDRTLLLGPKVALVVSDRQFIAAKKAAGVQCGDKLLSGPMLACVHSYAGADGQLVCIVGLNLSACTGMDGIDVAALLAHEAVHVWQRVREQMTGNLGDELEAYAVQNIAANLMRAFVTLASSQGRADAPAKARWAAKRNPQATGEKL